MAGIRRRAALVALMWLLSHASALAVSFAGLCCAPATSSASVADDDDDACCQGLAPGQMCPLHKHGSHQSNRRAPATQSPADCAMRSGCDADAVAFTSLTLDLGLLPPATVASSQPTHSVVPAGSPVLASRDVLPDPPPPRS